MVVEVVRGQDERGRQDGQAKNRGSNRMDRQDGCEIPKKMVICDPSLFSVANELVP